MGGEPLGSKMPVHTSQLEADWWHHPVPSSPQSPQSASNLQQPPPGDGFGEGVGFGVGVGCGCGEGTVPQAPQLRAQFAFIQSGFDSHSPFAAQSGQN